MKNHNGVLIFEQPPRIAAYASVVGKKEAEGPLRDDFDRIVHDSYFGQDTFEKAETEMMRTAVQTALEKGALTQEKVDVAFCGDLLNQCVASSFAMSGFGIPYVGIYGACSTMALGLMMSAIAVESGAAVCAVCAASSHYCTAERQYRMPLEYGSQRPPTAQWTVTGSGACVVEAAGRSTKRPQNGTNDCGRTSPADGCLPRICAACPGIITDLAVTDQNNMGAAMAPAVVKTGTLFFILIDYPDAEVYNRIKKKRFGHVRQQEKVIGMNDRIKRIHDMEDALDRARTAVNRLEEAWEGYLTVADDIDLLGLYLNSDERRSDLVADENGRLPADLRRGVLSEDAIWDLLERHDELMKEIKAYAVD